VKPAAIQILGMSKDYRRTRGLRDRLRGRPEGDPVRALSDVNLTIERGELFGLVGRNGYGKTTLIKSIAGLIEPTRGTVRVDGFDSTRQTLNVRRRVGVVTSEDRSFYWRLTGWQNLIFFARLHGLASDVANRRIGEWAELFGLEPILHRRVHGYSLGNRQRLAIVRALLADPPILLLDEPSRSLDPIVADAFRKIIRERVHGDGKRTVVITSNNLTDIEPVCGRVGILVRGRLVASAPMNELVKTFVPSETVLLRTRRHISANGLEPLRQRIPNLTWEWEGDDLLNIRFERRADDQELHWLLEKLMAAGHQILDCEVSGGGLRGIMESLEEKGAGHA
jgi:ABC-2 type transport system ATP-binding protein